MTFVGHRRLSPMVEFDSPSTISYSSIKVTILHRLRHCPDIVHFGDINLMILNDLL